MSPADRIRIYVGEPLRRLLDTRTRREHRGAPLEDASHDQEAPHAP